MNGKSVLATEAMNTQPTVTEFVHIGLVVEDLDETVRFLELLGFDCGKPAKFGGDWIERIIGIEDPQVEVLMARGPDGKDVFEVVRFRSPSGSAAEQAPAANQPGLRHVAFQVNDLRSITLSTPLRSVDHRRASACR
jgi:catechol 2,3-dioxygenase-like lactoylglutathione lyase family enzyme